MEVGGGDLEAKAAFGDGSVFLGSFFFERYVKRPRHIECRFVFVE